MESFSSGSLDSLNSRLLEESTVRWFSLMVVGLSTDPMILAHLSLFSASSICCWNTSSFFWTSFSLFLDLLESSFCSLWASGAAWLVFSVNPASSWLPSGLLLESLFLVRRAGSRGFFMEDLNSALGVNSGLRSDICLACQSKVLYLNQKLVQFNTTVVVLYS